MKHRWIIACCLALLPSSAWAETDFKHLLAPRHFVFSGAVASNYVAAMSAAEQVVLGEGMPLLSLRTRWLWISTNGSTVQRVAENTFRWRQGNCLDAFCVAVDCFVGLWPDMMCTDGLNRRIAAPDLGTVVLENETFKRDIP